MPIHGNQRHLPDGYSPERRGCNVAVYTSMYGVFHLSFLHPYSVDVSIKTTREGLEALRDCLNAALVQVPDVTDETDATGSGGQSS